ncbi:MAG: SciE type virulence protein [Planctomycetes bacterium]|nr:SciE type virulence protein [Planctomycetota bacterium]
MLAKDHYKAGQLKEAIAAATDEVKAKPGDLSPRALLCQLLFFSGDLERADNQLSAIEQLDTKQAVGVALLRQLLRAEQARRQFYHEGRLPEFLSQPSQELRARLEASIRLREKKPREAAELLEQAEGQRPPVAGVLNGEAFNDLRDLDDLTSSFFEVFTSNGKYYWIPFESVELLEFHAPAQPCDLLWRQAHMIVRSGPDGEVYLPALYFGSHSSADDRIRLGRATEWQGGDGAPVRGLGQRAFLAGERDLSILELKKIEFLAPKG